MCKAFRRRYHSSTTLSISMPLYVLACLATAYDYQSKEKQGNTNDSIADRPPPPQPAMPKSDPNKADLVSQCHTSTSYPPSRKCRRSPPARACILEIPTIQPKGACIAETSSAITPAPCKLITRLAANPNADITQLPLSPDGTNECDEEGGVQCSRAYQMLMQFATTEEKLDTIALALENGCVTNKSPGGGCKVQNKVLWKALDDIQN